jgi:hypothetical protein
MQVLKYQIFRITDDGLVKRPKRDLWDHDKSGYAGDYFNSPEEANEQLNNDENSGEFVILPVSTYTYESKD